MPAAAPALPAAGDLSAAADARAERDRHLAALLERAAAGDAGAFEAFFDATAGYARAMARRIVDGADLEDTLAAAYFDVWRRLPQFDAARGSAVAWLLTIVRSRALDLLRQRPAGGPEAVDQDDAADSLADPAAGPADRLWQTESQRQLHHALAELSAQERWVLGLAYFRELSHSAIAETTGLPLGSVKSLILRAQHKLRERLAP
jgi:RNA polymerase sigma-70 factor (ECF subfamily)